MRLPDLRKQITEYMRQGVIMEDVQASAEACQERINRLGYKWDSEKMLWRTPQRFSGRKERRGSPYSGIEVQDEMRVLRRTNVLAHGTEIAKATGGNHEM